MPYLAAAVIVVGVLCLLNLVLTFGVIRRLREHTTLLSQVSQGPGGLPPGVGMQPGETAAEFSATSITGEVVSHEMLSGRTAVGFFSPGCQPCAEQLPKFVEYAGSMPGGPERVLAVIAAMESEDDYVAQLAPVAQVVVEPPNGPVQSAFKVSGFPTVYLVEAGGVVAAGGLSVNVLEEAPPTATAAV